MFIDILKKKMIENLVVNGSSTYITFDVNEITDILENERSISDFAKIIELSDCLVMFLKDVEKPSQSTFVVDIVKEMLSSDEEVTNALEVADNLWHKGLLDLFTFLTVNRGKVPVILNYMGHSEEILLKNGKNVKAFNYNLLGMLLSAKENIVTEVCSFVDCVSLDGGSESKPISEVLTELMEGSRADLIFVSERGLQLLLDVR